MAWTETDLTSLETAIKRGTKRVRYQDGEVEYHSLAEMLQLRDQMRAESTGSSASDAVVYAARLT